MAQFRCIYCLKDEQEATPSISHIFPTSLGGTLELNDAVCQSCNSLINRETEEPFRRDWPFLLSLLGIRSRREKVPLVPAILHYEGERVKVYLNAEGEPSHVPPVIEATQVKKFGPGEEVEQFKKDYAEKHPNVVWTGMDLAKTSPPVSEFQLDFSKLCMPYARRFAAKVAFERLCQLRDPHEMAKQDHNTISVFLGFFLNN
ncbi:MAG: hypothetical protein HYZ11_06010 [Candidatus Tectomicrobia bacterium]|uniref:HNH endonuclease 5 domain-containing protein n=1 Tax=Tectimicrobiota bacterium TaxID=2528274 RepID=A0A932MMW4_UNCTE|nr:hypothetical protein [Candidatus Tectomicrobia bacterium]